MSPPSALSLPRARTVTLAPLVTAPWRRARVVFRVDVVALLKPTPIAPTDTARTLASVLLGGSARAVAVPVAWIGAVVGTVAVVLTLTVAVGVPPWSDTRPPPGAV